MAGTRSSPNPEPVGPFHALNGNQSNPNLDPHKADTAPRPDSRDSGNRNNAPDSNSTGNSASKSANNPSSAQTNSSGNFIMFFGGMLVMVVVGIIGGILAMVMNARPKSEKPNSRKKPNSIA